MHRFIVLLFVVLTASADKKDDMDKCVKLLKVDQQCCATIENTKRILQDGVKECLLMPRIPGSCDRALCFGTKGGFATDDGAIKMDVLEKKLTNVLSEDKDTLEIIKDKCLNGGYSLFGEPDDCELNKLSECLHWHLLFRCPEFADDKPCQDIKENAPMCLEMDV